MSTSLKVVSIAAVFCASFRRRAIVWRRRVIFTRSSRAASSAGEGARTWTAAAGCATGVGAAAARSIAAIMSPLVTRPSLPEPSTFAGSMPVSAAILRTDGASGASAAAILGGGAEAGFGCALDAGAGLGADFAAAGFAAAPAPSRTSPSSAPTATVSPSFAAMSPSVPAAGAGTSIVTLSVSSSTSGSSTATGSPGFLNHFPIVASVTDSPRVGTRISAMVDPLDVDARHKAGHDAKQLSQRLFEKRLELRLVLRHQAGRGCRHRGPARVARTAMLGLNVVEHPFDEGVDEEPRAHVARLFLAPHDLGFFEARQLGDQSLGGEWVELLDAQQVDVVKSALLALFEQIIIDLAGAQNDAPDLVVGHQLDLLVLVGLRIVPQQAMERGVRAQLIQPRH